MLEFIKDFDLFELAQSLGLKALIIIGIMGLTYALRLAFKPSDRVTLLLVFGIGIVIAILQIFVTKTSMIQWIEVAVGYPAVAVFAYDKFISKKIPDTVKAKTRKKK